MAAFRFPEAPAAPGLEALRAEVRDFLVRHRPAWTPEGRGRSWMGFDRGFSRAVGAQGWIGMTWPRAYGGQARSGLERYVVLEEMLAAGAPVGAHWIADRQSGPLLLNFGTEAQRQRYLPGIARGELAFCIGLSEPDSGSDLASLRTRASRVEGGWRLDGRKVWTTFAHLSDHMIALVRTSAPPEGKARQAGLSQMLVDLRAPGVTVRLIRDLEGEESFNEVTFDDVRLPEEALIGQVGAGWAQATAELAFERSGPDRYLSSYPLLEAMISALPAARHAEAAQPIGRLVARLMTLRRMSVATASLLDQGEAPAREAALVKDLGVDFEQAVPETARRLLEASPLAGDEAGRLLATLTQLAPTFSLRGGTREIMRGIIARELGLR